MAQEKEIKILLKINLSEFIKRILANGYRFVHKLNQADIYFDTRDWFLYKNIAALRLRKIDDIDNSFSFKKVFYIPNKNDYYVEEIETNFPLHDHEKIKQIFNKVNIPFKADVLLDGVTLTRYLAKCRFFDDQKVLKVRTVYAKNGDEIIIDDVDKVGTIVELECLKNDPLAVVKTLLKPNEWDRSLEGTSYIWLKNVKGLNSHIKNIERFKTKPDWNVWENEKAMYLKITK